MKIFDWFKGFFKPPPPAQGYGSCGILCESCDTWSAQLSPEEKARASYEDTYDRKELKALYTCGKCRHVSEWFTGAPMPIKYSDVRKVE